MIHRARARASERTATFKSRKNDIFGPPPGCKQFLGSRQDLRPSSFTHSQTFYKFPGHRKTVGSQRVFPVCTTFECQRSRQDARNIFSRSLTLRTSEGRTTIDNCFAYMNIIHI